MITQGGMWFELDVFMALVFVKLEFEYKIRKKAMGIRHKTNAEIELNKA